MNFLTFPVIRCSAREKNDNITIILLLICLKYKKGTGRKLISKLAVKGLHFVFHLVFKHWNLQTKKERNYGKILNQVKITSVYVSNLLQ